MSRIDIGHVPEREEGKAAQAKPDEDGEGTWTVEVYYEWHATWTSEAEAREHARRINEALEWSGS